ncbi:hypothetical protein JCGZ_01006 [Jatropha curcas]|uniref:Uncharacterized protein n=1 Tax=Jatropha curcas TaxID=180498 RepID=A0A067KWC1_JATCU|nr:hypothetical protein JCGZ_01005 [Jatropha curcas]KDP39249.1 hypothetical protein JCGZ_01006 [Jatropha curcas]
MVVRLVGSNYCEQLLGLLRQLEREGKSEGETGLELLRRREISRRRGKVEEQEARHHFSIEGCRGAPASSVCARDEREMRKEAGIRYDVEAMLVFNGRKKRRRRRRSGAAPCMREEEEKNNKTMKRSDSRGF